MQSSDIVRRRRARTRRGHGRAARSGRALAVVALAAAVMAVLVPLLALAGGAAGLLALVAGLPDVDSLRGLPARYEATTAASLLYAYDAPDAAGLRRPVLIDTIADPRQGGAGWIALDDLPPAAVDATLAALDPSFLTAPPADPFRAARDGWQTGAIGQTHSPLLRDLVATHLRDGQAAPPGDTRRAAQDWFLGWLIERRFGRAQVLEWTLNTAYYGHLAYGIEAAARLYFGVGAAELTPGQAALLAVAARDPATNPFDAPDAARAAAVELGATAAIDPAAVAGAMATLVPPPGSDSAAPVFARLARAELERLLGPERLVRGGYQVETTLDLALQQQAICVVAAATDNRPAGGGPPCPAAARLDEAGDATDVAVVALDPATGAVTALAADDLAARPIGTLVRPFIALTALGQGYTAASLTYDVARIYLQGGLPYVPPSEGDYLGPLRLREALAANRAAPAAQMLSWVGVAGVLDNARALGLSPAVAPPGLEFAQRGFPADLLSLSHAFAAIGHGGVLAGAPGDERPRPATVRRVSDATGAEVYALAPETRDTLSPELAWLLTDMLAGDALPDGRRVALAAGHSPDTGDGWAIATTPGQLVGVWAAGDEAEQGATAVSRALLAQAEAGRPVAEWPRPAGLRAVEVCALSGLLPQRGAAACPTVRDYFIPGTEPLATDAMTREVVVNRETGRLATIFTPPQLIERRVYTVYPPEVAAWAAEQGIPTPPVEYDTIRRVPTRQGDAAITSPEQWSVVSGQWSVTGSAGGPGFAYYRLAYFPALLPEAMQPIVARGETPVVNGELGVWDTTLLDDGLYTLLLTVVRQDGTFDEVAIPITVTREQE